MTSFEVWIPSGEAVLRNTETGEEMRLSSGSGPLSLGVVELAWRPGLGAVAPGAVPPESVKSAGEVQAEKAEKAEQPDQTEQPTLGLPPVPSVFGAAGAEPPSIGALGDVPTRAQTLTPPDEELPFLSPKDPIHPQPVRTFDRTLDAPLEALTREDFELVLETLAKARNDVEGELEFLQEIEAEPETIDAMEDELDRIDARFAAVSERLLEWEAAERRRDEEMGIAPED